jgi:hypothetical protein
LIDFENGLKVCEDIPNPLTSALYPFLSDFREFDSLPLKPLKNSFSDIDATSRSIKVDLERFPFHHRFVP